MNATVNYRQLPVSERIQLVEDIWDSIADEAADRLRLSAEEDAELQRRLDEHRADPASSRSWETVRANLFSRKR
jgi:putative addiction module component (TIGR02574 family)